MIVRDLVPEVDRTISILRRPVAIRVQTSNVGADDGVGWKEILNLVIICELTHAFLVLIYDCDLDSLTASSASV